MMQLHAINHLQQLARSKIGSPAENVYSPLLPGVPSSHASSHALSHAPVAGALYLKPSMLSRLTSRLSGPGDKFARLKELGSHCTRNAIFSAHTRVGCSHSPLNDLPLPLPAASLDRKLSVKQRQRKALAANRLQRSMSTARAAAAVGLFGSGVPATAVSSSAAPSGSMREAVDLIASLFPKATDQQFGYLQQQLHALDLPAQMDRTTLAYALAGASDGNVALAQQVLARLSQGLNLADMADRNVAGAEVEIAARARKLAGLLSQNDAGFAILKALHPSHADFGRSARVIVQSGMLDVRSDPSSFAARAHSAALRMLEPGAKLADAEKAAIFAWEQGFRSDGEGSPLHAAQRQLAKFAHKTIPRVEASRFATFIPRLCGRKKSPLVALRQGMQGANRQTLAKEREKVQVAMHATVGHLLADVLQDPAAILREDDPVGALASLAALRYWAGRPASYPGQRIAITDGAALARDMSCIIDTIEPADRCRYATQFAALNAALNAVREDPVTAFHNRPAIRRLMRQPLTPKRLAAWGKLRKIPAGEPFWQHLSELKATLRPREFRPLKRRHLSTQHSLGMLINSLKSSSRLRLTDGARRGVSTRGLSFNISRLLNFSGVPLGPRLNLGCEKRHRAVVEIGRSSHGGEILIGTERCRRNTLGIGLLVGYDLKLGPPQARIAASVDVERVQRRTEFSGVALRVAQREKADGTPDHERRNQGMRKIMDFMFNEQCTKTKSKDGAAQMFERFAATFFDDPDMSLSWSDARSKSTTYGASTAAAALVKLGGTPLNVGPGVSVTAQSTRTKASDVGNFTGRMQSAFSRLGKTTDVELTVGIRGKISTETPGESNTGLGIGLLNASLPEWTSPVYTSGTAGKALLVRENGRLLPSCSVLDLEFNHAHAYVEALNADRYRWIERLSSKYVGNPDAAKLAGEQFDGFLDTARHHARRNQRFVQRMHLRADIASKIDSHCATAALIRDNLQISVEERDRLCAARETACANLVSQPGAWVPKELKILEKSASCSRQGLLMGVQVATETSAEGEHQLAKLRV